MMRRSSGMGGARMLRAMGRSVGAGVKEKFSTAVAHGSKTAGRSPAQVVSVSSPPTPASSSTSLSKSSLTCYVDGDEWEPIGDDDITRDGDVVANGFGFRERYVFGPAPTKQETEEAISTIQQMLVPVSFSQVAEMEYPSSVDGDVADKMVTSTDVVTGDSSTESELDWKEPAMLLCSPRSSQSNGQDILAAVHLFEISTPFQRLVSSLSSDPAVWNAVMNNGLVQELKDTFFEAENSEPRAPGEDPDVRPGILRWIINGTKGKIMEFFDMISKLVNQIFHPPEKVKEPEAFDNFVRSSFTLCVVVFIIVVATRIQKS